MAKLVISDGLLSEIGRHAEKTYPEECCGVLLGRQEVVGASETVRVTSVTPTANVHTGTKGARYSIAAETLLRIHKEARQDGEEVVGYYHSHPDRTALPSDTDLASAVEGVSYLIVSVKRGDACAARAWRLRLGESEFEEEEIG